MLWCKKTFQQHFSEEKCRIFPTQQMLFDFVDHGSSTGEWLPFSIEFPSELEVARKLSRHGTSRSSPLFSEQRAPSSASSELPGQKRYRAALREDYSLLYGETPLSQQNRMFLAVTREGLWEVIDTIDPAQLHLYEIIRDGATCHLYFDVERDSNTTAVHQEMDVDVDADGDDNADDECTSFRNIVSTTVQTRHGPLKYSTSEAEYKAKLQSVPSMPPRRCPLSCQIVPRNELTKDVLLSELARFTGEQFPELLTSPPERFLEDSTELVIIMESKPLLNTTQQKQSKFSQHYVIAFRHHVFSDNITVGEFVKQFVLYLDGRSMEDPVVHAALFFHGDAVMENVLTSICAETPSPSLPFLHRRCVIDTAVYSRNRMMRCVGSCKLGKESVLQFESIFQHGKKRDDVRLTRESFWDSLISCSLQATSCVASGGSRSMFKLDVTNASTGPRYSSCSGDARSAGNSAIVVDAMGDEETIRCLESAYTLVSNKPCRVGSVKQVGTNFFVYQIIGSRFCQHVMREHKSNGVYIVVDTAQRTWSQKCFDPDCAHYRSPPIPLTGPA